jgi:hypothetical protein
MENPENSDRKIEVIIRCIHPNLNWTPQEGPDYSTFYPAMTTLVEDFRARVQSKILFRSAFFKAILEKDIQVFSKGKAIEVKLTSRKHQVSVESMLMCLDYLDHLSLFEIDIHRKNMLALLVTANFLKIEQLENYFADFVGNNLKSKHVIDIANIASQIKNFRLLDKAYV